MLRKTGPILILSWTSGCLDALGFLGLGRVFTANMTGNTVLFGMALAQENWPDMWRSLIALIGFGLGVIIGSLLIDLNKQREQAWTPEVTRALIVEACILLLFALGWLFLRPVVAGNLSGNLLIGVSALAMGQQSITVLKLGLPGITTTYITGTITTLMADVARLLSLSFRNPPVLTPAMENRLEHEKPVRLVSVLLTYIIAAIMGGYGELHFALLTAFLPLTAIIVAILLHYMPLNAKGDVHPG